MVTEIMINLTCRAKSIDGSTRKEISSFFPRTVLIKTYRPSMPTMAESTSSITISSYISGANKQIAETSKA